MRQNENNPGLSVIVVGASGHLARRKIFPALFSLYAQGLLPRDVNMFGFARSDYSQDGFRKHIAEHLTCRYTPEESCADTISNFLSRCFYCKGNYSEPDAFLNLCQLMRDVEIEPDATNRCFYLAIPPAIFTDTAHAIGGAGFVQCGVGDPWSRVVVEKPFGHDRRSSDALIRDLSDVFTEDQTYRIDHYLGKEMVQNLMVFRFANIVFEPIWNKDFIQDVSILWKEPAGIEGRAGYFDEYGIIRDVMQNHLTQILALVAMERPDKLDSCHVMQEKATLLRRVVAANVGDSVIGQYEGYQDVEGVAAGSRTATYASIPLRINNSRWKGVPFRMTAGKGLDTAVTQIRLRFREVAGNLFCANGRNCPDANELIIRVQPDEGIHMRVVTKVPGLETRLATTDLDLSYRARFDQVIPDAYESLLLDVFQGDRTLFIWRDELQVAWDIFTPMLHEYDKVGASPAKYLKGTSGPSVVS